MPDRSRRRGKYRGPVLMRGSQVDHTTTDQRLLDNRGPSDWVHSDPWRVMRITGEFVEGFGALAELGPAIAVFGSARTPTDNPYYAIAEEVGRKLVEAGFDVIDGNFGCPSKSAVGGCRGGYHLAQPTNALEIVARVRETVPPHVPVTVKMRRGIDGSDESREKCLEILDGVFRLGAAAVTLHGRTVEQGYVGASRWAFVKEAKAAYPDRTILGSGDLFTATDCVRMLAETGVDGVSVARGAIGNPWVFEQIPGAGDGETGVPAPAAETPARDEVCDELEHHVAGMVELYGEGIGLRIARKVVAAYLRGRGFARDLRGQVNTLSTWQEFAGLLARLRG